MSVVRTRSFRPQQRRGHTESLTIILLEIIINEYKTNNEDMECEVSNQCEIEMLCAMDAMSVCGCVIQNKSNQTKQKQAGSWLSRWERENELVTQV